MVMLTLNQDVKKYFDGLENPPNAWGCHTVDGMYSHFFLAQMYKKYGRENVEKEIDRWRKSNANI